MKIEKYTPSVLIALSFSDVIGKLNENYFIVFKPRFKYI